MTGTILIGGALAQWADLGRQGLSTDFPRNVETAALRRPGSHDSRKRSPRGPQYVALD